MFRNYEDADTDAPRKREGKEKASSQVRKLMRAPYPQNVYAHAIRGLAGSFSFLRPRCLLFRAEWSFPRPTESGVFPESPGVPAALDAGARGSLPHPPTPESDSHDESPSCSK